jgi:hypothetical protein
MNDDKLPYPDDEIEDIPPDVAAHEERPLEPSESSLDENRQDQWDAHHGEPDDIV